MAQQSETVYDEFDTAISSDSSTSPSYLPPSMMAVSVNRMYRGGINKTRDAFIELNLQVSAGQDPSILEEFRLGNFQGAYAYQSIKPDASDGIAVAVAGSIYFIALINNVGYLSKLISGNDPDMMLTWFVQAEDWLYIQNGYQNPIAWDGVNAAFRLNPAANKMPIGTIMEYAYGRVWVSDKYNNIYASDIIFGNGFTDTANTQNFTEQTYWQEGGSFTPPARFGQITGMKVLPTINLNDRGQGELVVGCESGFFTINGTIPREQWIDTNIQKISLFGRGNVAPYSMCGVNNEIIFRADDGWSLYSNAQLDFQQRLSFRKLSKEVNPWVDSETKALRQYESAMFFDNRIIATCSPYTVRVNDESALHRPCRAMVVLDLDQGTGVAPDAELGFRWNGLWEGPQPTQLLTAQIRGEQRALCFSFDSDNVNRLYELTPGQVDDFGNARTVKIKSMFETKRFNFSGTQKTDGFLRKTLTGGQIFVSDISEEVGIDVDYRADKYACYNDLTQSSIGCDTCATVTEDCVLASSEPRYGVRNFQTPKKGVCQIGNKVPLTSGREFQIKVELEGRATVDQMRLIAQTNPMDDTVARCETDSFCEEKIQCCVPVLDFYRIV